MPSTYWTNIFKSVTAYATPISNDAVLNILKEVKDELIQGVLLFKPYRSTHLMIPKENTPEKILLANITNALSEQMDLDASQTIGLLQNYLMYDYFGEANDIVGMHNSPKQMQELLEAMWLFYRSERMFILKILRKLLEPHESTDRYAWAYEKFLTQDLLVDLKENMIAQFEMLVSELDGSKYTNEGWTYSFVERNMVELTESLIVLMYTHSNLEFTYEEFVRVFRACKLHEFGRKPPVYPELSRYMRPGDYNTICHMEYALIIHCFRDRWNDVIWNQYVEKFEKEVKESCYQWPTLYIVLVSALLKTIERRDVEKFQKDMTYFFRNGFNGERFAELAALLRLPIFTTPKLGDVVRDSIWKMFQYFSFEMEWAIYKCYMQTAMELLSELFVNKECYMQTLEAPDCTRYLLTEAVNKFPIDFASLTDISTKLVQHEDLRMQVCEILCNMEVYTEYTESDKSMDVKVLERSYETELGIVIPKGATRRPAEVGVFILSSYTHDDFTYSYFEVLRHYLVTFFNKFCPEDGTIIAMALLRSVQGLKLMSTLLKYSDTMNWIDGYFHDCIKVLRKFLISEKLATTEETWELYTLSFELVCVTLPQKDLTRADMMFMLQILPRINVDWFDTVDGLAPGNVHYEQRGILQYVEAGYQEGDYRWFNAYFGFWQHVMHYGSPTDNLSVFLMSPLAYFFSKLSHIEAVNCPLTAKLEFINKFLKFISDILVMNTRSMHPNVALIKKYIHHEVLHNSDFLTLYKRILRFSIWPLTKEVVNDVRWDASENTLTTNVVMNALVLTLRLFTWTDIKVIQGSPFWMYFYKRKEQTEKHTLQFLCEYMSFKYDKQIPKLACDILRHICEDKETPVFPEIGMAPTQLMGLILDRLQNPMEDVELKTHIVNLVKTCVVHQDGLAAMLFKYDVRYSLILDCSMTTFIENILHEICKIDRRSYQVLEAAVLDLILTLWSTYRVHLIESLIAKPTFWPSILKPLCQRSLTMPDLAYSAVLDIVTFQICRHTVTPTLKKELEKHFLEDGSVTGQFCTHLLEAFRTGLEEESEKAMYSWLKFMMTMIYNYGDSFCLDTKVAITKAARIGYISSDVLARNLNVAEYWSQIYLSAIMNWGVDCKEPEFSLREVTQMFVVFQHYYFEASEMAVQTMLNIIVCSFKHFNNRIRESPQSVAKILEVMQVILDNIYRVVREDVHDSNNDPQRYVTWSLLLTFGCHVLRHCTVLVPWLHSSRMLEMVFCIAPFFISHPRTMKVAMLSYSFLYLYAKSIKGLDVVRLNFPMMYRRLTIPKFYMDFEPFQNKSFIKIAKVFEDFWITLSLLLKFMTVVWENFSSEMKLYVNEFMYSFKQDLMWILFLPRMTTHTAALKLVVNYLELAHFGFKYVPPRMQISNVHFDAMCHCLLSCVSIILNTRQPRYHKLLDNSIQLLPISVVPLQSLVIVMNSITDVIGSLAKVFLTISPNLIDILNHRPPRTEIHKLIDFDTEFLVPLPMEVEGQKITGGILCIVHYLCKTLSQIILKREPHNILTPNISSRHVYGVEKGEKPPNEDENEHVSVSEFAQTEIHTLTAPWMKYMDPESVLPALEAVMTLLAVQVYRCLRDNYQNRKKLQLIKRNMCTELQFYHEFVRKKLMDPQRFVIDGHFIMKSQLFDKVPRTFTTDYDYLLFLSHWFLNICHIKP